MSHYRILNRTLHFYFFKELNQKEIRLRPSVILPRMVINIEESTHTACFLNACLYWEQRQAAI